ncbi:MAG: hypothetical protein KAY24_08150, partial [Candidatus Eisenbacteria sp.]|nr:hypothetical protein [Candidatus Eisenbacteria bacterium]
YSSEVITDSLGHIGSDHYAVFSTYRRPSPAAVDVGESAQGRCHLWALPNPAFDGCHIKYRLDATAPLKLQIYSVSGRLVRILAEGWRASGTYDLYWDGRDETGRPEPAGTYYLVLKSPLGSRSVRVVNCPIAP